MLNTKPSVLALIGSTCTYKSKIAIELAKKYPFEIISADSRLVYKGMDIGTSKPSLEERKDIPHHMVDIVEPDFNYSVALYKKEVEQRTNEIFARGKTPLIVGGTGLYINSVLLGLNIPEVKPDLSFRRQLKEYTQEELYRNLSVLDPKACNIIHKNDNFRTIRALEVIYKTNKLFSKLKTMCALPFNVKWIGLSYQDKELHTQTIKTRTEAFCNNGFVEEVKILISKFGIIDLFKNTIGYKEAIDYLNNKITKEEMIAKIILHTKQFAKRQATWFKANKNIQWICLDDLQEEQLLNEIDKQLTLAS